MNEFQERYKSYPLRKLITIVVEAEKYDVNAVDAAKLELKVRGLSDEQLQMHKEEIREEAELKEELHPTVELAGKQAKKIGGELYELINPLDQKKLTLKRKIALTAIFVGFLAVKNLYQELIYLKYSLSSYDYEFDWLQFSFLVPVVICVGVFRFWKRERVGWIVTTAFVAFMCAMNVIALYQSCKANLELYFSPISDSSELADLFHQFYPTTPMIVSLLFVAVFSGLLYVLNQRDIRSEFSIDKKASLFTIGAGVTALVLFYLAILFL